MHIGPTQKLGDEKLGDNSPRSPTSSRSLSFRPGLGSLAVNPQGKFIDILISSGIKGIESI